jgi:hypothetical protein
MTKFGFAQPVQRLRDFPDLASPETPRARNKEEVFCFFFSKKKRFAWLAILA